jgi:hypothetical protein
MVTGATNPGRRNSDSGSIGLAVRDSAATKATAAASEQARPASTHGLVKPYDPASITAAAKPARAIVASAAPRVSTRRLAERSVSEAYRRASQNPAAPSGTLMKKMARQPNAAIRKPPMTGPPDRAALAPATNCPTARVRRPGSV